MTDSTEPVLVAPSLPAPDKATRPRKAKPVEKTSGWFLTEGGSIVLMDLPLPAVIADRVLKGAIIEVADEFGTPLEHPEPVDDLNALDRIAMFAPPPASASKQAWVGYAVRHGGMSAEGADSLTKQDLIDRFTK